MFNIQGDTLKLPEQVTLREVAAFTQPLRKALRAGVRRLDWSGVRQVDSSALALIADARRCQPGLALRGVPDNLRALALLYGASFLLGDDGMVAAEPA